MSGTERIKKAIKYLIGRDIIENQRSLAKKINITESYLSQVINNKTPITKDFISALCKLEETLNRQWLLTGEGAMLNDTPTTEQFQDVEMLTSEEVEELNNCESCKYRIPFIPDKIVHSPDVDIRSLINSKPEQLQFSTLRELIGEEVNFYLRVTTSAMSPDFIPGDILLIRFISQSNVISGGIYILDSNVKGCLVRQVDYDDTNYTLHASNPDYRELVLSKDDIMSIGRVVCLLRTNFNLTPSNIATQTRLKTKSDQIDKLIDSHSKLISEQSKLVDEIVRQNERHDKLIDIQRQLVESFTNTINTFNHAKN